MTPDEYVLSIITQKSLGTGFVTDQLANQLYTLITRWAGQFLLGVTYSGSYSKGTAVQGSSDVDLFISLHPDLQDTLRSCYEGLYTYLRTSGYSARKQHVSIGVTYAGLSIDLTPGKKLPGNTSDHHLYNHKKGTWTKTNIIYHTNLIANSGRINEIKAIKIWRNINQLEFPSIYLELSVIKALYRRSTYSIATNVLNVLKYLRDDFLGETIIDPSNSANIISDDLTMDEKRLISAFAESSRTQANWGSILW